MITIIAAAIITVVTIVLLLTPLMLHESSRKQGWGLLYIITIIAMGIYLWNGSPDISSQAAFFESSGENHEKRRLVKKELELMRELADSPQDTQLMLSLGSVRLQNGRIKEAITVLNMAYELNPDEIKQIKLKLGSAYYAAALSDLLIDNNSSGAKENFDKALSITPKDAPYLERLKRDIKSFQEEGE